VFGLPEKFRLAHEELENIPGVFSAFVLFPHRYGQSFLQLDCFQAFGIKGYTLGGAIHTYVQINEVE